MPAYVTLTLAVAACVVAHLLVMAAVGARLGLPLREISLGFGPAWLHVGRLRLGVIPLGGYVQFSTPPEEALGFASQLFLALIGTAALLALSIALVGDAGLIAFLHGFRQWFVGATSPLGAAQAMLEAVRRQAVEGTFVATLGLAAAKVAAANLMPWPGTNGGAALAIVGGRLGLARRWPEGASRTLMGLSLLVLASWIVAVAVFVLRH